MPIPVAIADFFSASKAFLIGVGKYSPPIQQLTSPAADVQRLGQVLTTRHGFMPPAILIDPCRRQLLDFIANIQVVEADRILIYFAGHGIAIDDKTPSGYLLPADAKPEDKNSFISMDTLLEAIGKLPCRHLLLVLDCCYAGAFRWTLRTRSLGSDVPKTIYYERFEQYAKNKAWQVLTSSAYDQKAIDILRLGKRDTNGSDGNSPYMKLFCSALETGAADLRFGNGQPDGIITASELNFYLRQQIFEELAAADIDPDDRQVPQIFPLPPPGAPYNDKGEFLFLNPTVKDHKNSVPLEPQTNENPYKGLYTYTRKDGKLFYGRQRVLDGWDGHPGLKEAVQQYALVIVTGPSGIGKSSLVRAGLYSFLTTGLIDIRPGKTPALTHEKLLKPLAAVTTRNTILVDQYEELLTLCQSRQEREDFEALLLAALKNHTIILTVRSDFEKQFRKTALFERSTPEDIRRKLIFVVPPYLRSEIREIVTLPAVQEILEFKSLDRSPENDQRFVDRIIDESFLFPGSLPLLSLALSELYERKEDRSLLESAYDDFDGINGILDKKAKAEFEQYAKDPLGTEVFKLLIFRMIAMEGGRIARRRVYTSLDTSMAEEYDELIFPDPQKTRKIKTIAAALVHSRLLRSDLDENDLPYIEPSHEALLRSWPLLLEWLKETNGTGTTEQSKLLLHKAVTDIAVIYAKAQKTQEHLSRKYLWVDDPRLSEVDTTLRSHLNKPETVFVQDSLKARRRHIRRRYLMITTAILALIVGMILYYQQQLANQQQVQKTQALGMLQLARTAEPTEALSFLKAAYDLDSTNNDILSAIITETEFTRGTNQLIRKNFDFNSLISYLLYINDSSYAAAAANGYMILQTPAGRKNIPIAVTQAYPEIALTPDSSYIWAYASDDPAFASVSGAAVATDEGTLKEYDLRGNLVDSLPLERLVDIPISGGISFLPGRKKLYVLSQGIVVAKQYTAPDLGPSHPPVTMDTILPPAYPVWKEYFTDMALYKNGTALLLGTTKGSLLLLDSGARQPKLLRKTPMGIGLVEGCQNNAIAIGSYDTSITVFDQSLRPIHTLKAARYHRWIRALQPFPHSPKILIQFETHCDSVMIWNYQTNTLVTINQPDSWDNSDISPSENSILTCGSTQIGLHDTAGTLLFHYNANANTELSVVRFIGSDNHFFALSSTAHKVFFWNLDSSGLSQSLYRYKLNARFSYSADHRSSEPANFVLLKQINDYIGSPARSWNVFPYNAAISTNGTWYIYQTRAGWVYHLTPAGTDSFQIAMGSDEDLDLLGFTRNSDSLIAFTTRGTITVRPVSHPERYRTLMKTQTITQSQWSQDANTWCSGYTMPSTFACYNLDGHRIDTGEMTAQQWSLDGSGSRLIYYMSDTLVIRSLATGKETRTKMPDYFILNPVIAPQGDYLAYSVPEASGTETIKLYSVKDDKPDALLHTYESSRDPADRLLSLKFATDERTIIAHYPDNILVNFLTPLGAKRWIQSVGDDKVKTR